MGQGKQMAFASRRLAYALDCMSKNTALDILVDRAHQQLGIETANTPADEARVCDVIQSWATPVAAMRGDRISLFTARMEKFDEYSRRYLSRQAAGGAS